MLLKKSIWKFEQPLTQALERLFHLVTTLSKYAAHLINTVSQYGGKQETASLHLAHPFYELIASFQVAITTQCLNRTMKHSCRTVRTTSNSPMSMSSVINGRR